MQNTYLQEELKLKNPPISVILTDDLPDDAIEFNAAKIGGGCSLSALNEVAKGKSIFFSKDTKGCIGLKPGLGFEDAGSMPGGIEYFLSCGKGQGYPEGEKIKKNPEVARAFYYGLPKKVVDTKYILLKPAEETDKAKLVIFLANPDQLSALVHLFAYESASTDNVFMPMCSGCTSIFKLPLAELEKDNPRASVGLVDIWARPPFDADLFAFTVPFNAYLQMLENSKDCFLQVKTWAGVKKRL